jgi:putative lipoic acid-binding regulatory protein
VCRLSIDKEKILNNKRQEKLKIEYPCEWGFKLIGKDKEKLEALVSDIMEDKEYRCKEGNVSKNGNFVTLNTYCEVCSQEERDKFFKAFQEHNDVKMVI